MSVSGIVRDSDGFPVGICDIANTDPEITTVSAQMVLFHSTVLEGDYLISVTPLHMPPTKATQSSSSDLNSGLPSC
jgi:hypothetical protein